MRITAGVAAGLPSGDGHELTEAGADAINQRLEQALEERWPAESWYVIPDGELSPRWNVYVRAYGAELPNAEQEEFARAFVEDAVCGDPEPGWWATVKPEEDEDVRYAVLVTDRSCTQGEHYVLDVVAGDLETVLESAELPVRLDDPEADPETAADEWLWYHNLWRDEAWAEFGPFAFIARLRD